MEEGKKNNKKNDKKNDKRSDKEIDKEKDRKKKAISLIIPEGIALLLVCLGQLMEPGLQNRVCYMVLSGTGILVAGYTVRFGMLEDEDLSGIFYQRKWFWICADIGIVLAFSCAFLPTLVWPFLPLYIVLTLFGGLEAGVIMGTTLLALPVLLGKVQLPVFFAYFFSGVMGCILFRNLKKSFRAGLPVVLALCGQLVCEGTMVFLVSGDWMQTENLLLYGMNFVISAVLLLGILKIYSEKVIYRYRLVYLDLNNPENELLKNLKAENKRDYMKCIHTAYFCERIALKLGMDEEALKCAGYYHSQAKLEEMIQQGQFPPGCTDILEDYLYNHGKIHYRETAVLMASQRIISQIYCLIDEGDGKSIEYRRAIQDVFQRMEQTQVLEHCNLTMAEYTAMKKIFEEEKLYYDFLC